MATKKQKRALGEARQAENLAHSIASGLKAQNRDRLRRAKREEENRQKEQLKAHQRIVADIKSGLPVGEGDDGGCN